MRHSHVLVLAGVLGASSFAIACENDSSSGGSSGASGGTNVFDGGGPPGEGGPPPVTPPPKGTGVTLSVRFNGAAAAGARVYFHDEAGAVTSDLKADAKGVVSAPVAPKQITVGTPGGMITYTDVEEGDVLAVDVPGDESQLPVVGTLVATVGPRDGASSYEVFSGGCSGGTNVAGQAFDVALYEPCIANGTTGLVAVAYGVGTQGVMYSRLDFPAPAAGQTKPVGLVGGPGDWKEAHTGTIKLTGTTANVNTLLELFYAGVPFSPTTRSGQATDPTGERYAMPAREGTVLAGVSFRQTGAEGSAYIATRSSLNGAASTGDFTATFSAVDALPPITEAVATVKDGRIELKATMAAAQTADLAVAQLTVAGGGELQGGKWMFVMNPKRSTWTSPVLPPPPVAPPPGTASIVDVAFDYVESTTLSSFAEAKTLRIDPAMRYVLTNAPLVKDGTVRHTSVGEFSP